MGTLAGCLARTAAFMLLMPGCGSSPVGDSCAGPDPEYGCRSVWDVPGTEFKPPSWAGGSTSGPELCALELGVLLEPCSEDDYEALLIGKWWQCSGDPFPAEGVGVEYAADHQWYALVQDASGAVQRASDFESQGSWQLADTGAVVGQCAAQLGVGYSDGSGVGVNLSSPRLSPRDPTRSVESRSFSDGPRTLSIPGYPEDSTAGFPEDLIYVAIP